MHLKKYVKNKNFVPIHFVESIDIISNEKNDKLIFILILINFLIIPSSISKISNEVNNNKVISVMNNYEENKDNNKDINRKNLILVLKSIDNSVRNIRIQNNGGFIEVDSIEEIYRIEEEKNFRIKSASIKDNIVTIEVEL